jgi:hypothetical protein
VYARAVGLRDLTPDLHTSQLCQGSQSLGREHLAGMNKTLAIDVDRFKLYVHGHRQRGTQRQLGH